MPPQNFIKTASTRPCLMAACLALLTLTGCDKAEPRSTQYFSAHLDEARQIVSQCRDGSVRGEECANADNAVQEAEAKEKFRRFRGQ